MSSTTLRGAGYSGNITELYDALKEVWQSDMMALINDGTMLPKYRWDFYDLGNGVANVATLGKQLTPTFTRASTATTVGSDGTVIKGIANDSPRSWYNPTTLAYEGLLMEGARTNLCLRSEEFDNASWSKVDTTITPNSIAAPDGTTTADLCTEGTGGTANIRQDITGTADATFCVSVWLKSGNHSWVRLTLQEGSSAANRCDGYFNLATGETGVLNVGTGTGAAATIVTYPNGWYRCSLSGAVNNAATNIGFLMASASGNGNTTRVANGTRYVWGAQFENNVSFPSSYIPTTTGSVTRAVDALSYPLSGTNVSVSATWYPNAVGLSLQEVVAELYTDGNNRSVMFKETSDQTTQYVVQGGGAQATNAAAGTLSNGVETTGAIRSANNNFAAVRDGGTVVTDVSGTAPAWTTVGFGSSVVGVAPQGMRIRAATLFDRAVEDAHLQGMT